MTQLLRLLCCRERPGGEQSRTNLRLSRLLRVAKEHSTSRYARLVDLLQFFTVPQALLEVPLDGLLAQARFTADARVTAVVQFDRDA